MYTLHLGNSMSVLPTLPADSVDSIVTDPPYELGFMGKSWDASGIAYSVKLWQEALRVLKPGGHLLAFSGSRTYHRMTCAIEDAGFEIRDSIMWVYSTGFPKSMNLDRMRGELFCDCDKGTLPKAEREVHSVCDTDVPQTVDSCEGGGEVLQSCLSEQGAPTTGRKQFTAAEIRSEQPGMEGWRDNFQKEGQLREHPISARTGTLETDGTQGRVRNGTQTGNGRMVQETLDKDGSSAPRRPQSTEQQKGKSGTVAGQSKPQTGGAWPLCDGCGKPDIPRGLGSALKPAHEPICVARKPLSKGLTVAANVLAHGTGALNIDGCRVCVSEDEPNKRAATGANGGAGSMFGVGNSKRPATLSDGRWPANLIHSGLTEEWARFFYCAKTSKKDRNTGCEEVMTWEHADLNGLILEAQSQLKDISETIIPFLDGSEWNTMSSGSDITEQFPEGMTYIIRTVIRLITESRTWNSSQSSTIKENILDVTRTLTANGSSLAGSVDVLNQSLQSITDELTVSVLGAVLAVLKTLLPISESAKKGNVHSTVKPTDLMRYLCRLVTPPGGTVLDPFMGSGSTGKAAALEEFRFIGIEMDETYHTIAKARIEAACMTLFADML